MRDVARSALLTGGVKLIPAEPLEDTIRVWT